MAAAEVTAPNFLGEIRLCGAGPCGQEEGGGAYSACEAYGSDHTPPAAGASLRSGWTDRESYPQPRRRRNRGGCGVGIPGLRRRADIGKVRFLVRIGRLRGCARGGV